MCGAAASRSACAYLLVLELFDGEAGLPLGEDVEPEAAPPEACPEELPLAPEGDEDGLL